MKRKAISIIVLMILILLSTLYPVNVLAGMDSYQNEQMSIDVKNSNFYNISSNIDGWKSTTYQEAGYKTSIKVGSSVSTLDLTEYEENGLKCNVESAFIQDNRYALISYIINNTTDAPITFSIAVDGTVQLDGEPMTIERIGNNLGYRLYNEKYQHIMQGKGNTSISGGIDSLWIGDMQDNTTNIFESNDLNDLQENYCKIAFAWNNRTVEAKGTMTLSYLVGMSLNDVNPTIKFANDETTYYKSNTVIPVQIVDNKEELSSKLYYQLDKEDIFTMNVSKSEAEVNVNLTSKKITEGDHSITIWLINENRKYF